MSPCSLVIDDLDRPGLSVEVRTTNRTLYRDTIPYDVPSSLAALRGPSGGLIELPITVFWGPDRVFDLNSAGDRLCAYQALVREGTPDVQEGFLNEGLLRREWGKLMLPDRCRAAWEAVFPDLAVPQSRPRA